MKAARCLTAHRAPGKGSPGRIGLVLGTRAWESGQRISGNVWCLHVSGDKGLVDQHLSGVPGGCGSLWATPLPFPMGMRTFYSSLQGKVRTCLHISGCTSQTFTHPPSLRIHGTPEPCPGSEDHLNPREEAVTSGP